MFVESKEKPSGYRLGLVTLNIALSCMTAGFALAGNTDVIDIWEV